VEKISLEDGEEAKKYTIRFGDGKEFEIYEGPHLQLYHYMKEELGMKTQFIKFLTSVKGVPAGMKYMVAAVCEGKLAGYGGFDPENRQFIGVAVYPEFKEIELDSVLVYLIRHKMRSLSRRMAWCWRIDWGRLEFYLSLGAQVYYKGGWLGFNLPRRWKSEYFVREDGILIKVRNRKGEDSLMVIRDPRAEPGYKVKALTKASRIKLTRYQKKKVGSLIRVKKLFEFV